MVAAMSESVEITEEPWPVRYPVIWLPHGLRRDDAAAVITVSEPPGCRGGVGGILTPVGA